MENEFINIYGKEKYSFVEDVTKDFKIFLKNNDFYEDDEEFSDGIRNYLNKYKKTRN